MFDTLSDWKFDKVGGLGLTDSMARAVLKGPYILRNISRHNDSHVKPVTVSVVSETEFIY